jgi:hypothetical protein
LKGRLFTFGCSFTNYRWSTWADILASEFDYHENWGQSGAGNHYIFNSIVEANQRHNFATGDTVVVCWTNVMREDRYTDRWQTLGNVTTCPIYQPEYVRDAVTERGCLIRDMAMIKAAMILLNTKRNLTWRFTSVCPMGNPRQFDDSAGQDQDVLSLYQDVLNTMLPSYQQTIFKNGWRSNGDPHPTPLEHLAYLDQVLPGWVTNDEIRATIVQESKNIQLNRSGLSTVTRL